VRVLEADRDGRSFSSEDLARGGDRFEVNVIEGDLDGAPGGITLGARKQSFNKRVL